METKLTTAEVASLMDCSKQYVRRLAKEGKLKGEKPEGAPDWAFSIEAIEAFSPRYIQKYFDQLKASIPEARLPEGTEVKQVRPLDSYTAEEREEIAWWIATVKEWRSYRAKYKGSKAEADDKFTALCARIDPERTFSVDTLYRRAKRLDEGDLDGLIDLRGKWKKGRSSIDETLWDAFLSFYLDEAQHPIRRCYEYTQMWARSDFPDLVATIPTYTTFYRRVQKDIPEAVEVLGRQGEKAFPSADSPFAKYADREPMEYIRLLKKWKSQPQPIRVIISDCDFNLAMSIDELTEIHREGDKDVYYTLKLSEYRFLNVAAVKSATATKSKASGLTTRPNAQPAPKTHTVVSGDCLWNLAKKFYGNGAQYTKIYNANKGVLGSDPNKIKVGQKLVIP